jgi:hypothetical protein
MTNEGRRERTKLKRGQREARVYVEISQLRPIRIKSIVIEITELFCKSINIHRRNYSSAKRRKKDLCWCCSWGGHVLCWSLRNGDALVDLCGKHVTLLSDYARVQSDWLRKGKGEPYPIWMRKGDAEGGKKACSKWEIYRLVSEGNRRTDYRSRHSLKFPIDKNYIWFSLR